MRILHRVGEDHGALRELGRGAQCFRQAVPEEHVVTENHADRLSGNELPANNEGVRQAARLVLCRIGEAQSPFLTVSQKSLK